MSQHLLSKLRVEIATSFEGDVSSSATAESMQHNERRLILKIFALVCIGSTVAVLLS